MAVSFNCSSHYKVIWNTKNLAPNSFKLIGIFRLETEIEKQRIVIRADKQMNKDLGVKKKLLIVSDSKFVLKEFLDQIFQYF